MKRFVLILFSMLIINIVHAQQFSIESIEKLPTDMDARVNYARKDQNGKTCAIIKMATPLTGFSFDTGTLSVQYVVEKTGEIWIYVQPGIRKITIAHQSLGVVREWDIPIKIEEACSYSLTIRTKEVNTTNVSPSKKGTYSRKVLYTLREHEEISYGEALLSLRYRPDGDHFAAIIYNSYFRKNYLVVDGMKKIIADSIIVNYIDFDNFANSNYAYRETILEDGAYYNSWTIWQEGKALKYYREPTFNQSKYCLQNSANNIHWTSPMGFSYYTKDGIKTYTSLNKTYKRNSGIKKSNFRTDSLYNGKDKIICRKFGELVINGKLHIIKDPVPLIDPQKQIVALFENGSIAYIYWNQEETHRLYLNSATNYSIYSLKDEEDYNFIKGVVSLRPFCYEGFFNYTGYSYKCVYFQEKDMRSLKDFNGEHILETCLAYDYVLVDNQEIGKSPALGIWYVPNEKNMNKGKFIWTALENRELVSYTYDF